MNRSRSSIATVCLSGTLDDKLAAAAAAGFDGIELFEPDLVASPRRPAEIRGRCADLGLTIDLYQPFRDLDSTDPDRVPANLRRLRHKLDLMAELGTDLLLVCSSVSPDAVADDDRLADQLAAAADLAAARGIRLAYEALAWGTHVSTYEHSWEIVRRAGHPALGLCLDSFHILARRDDPSRIEEIPGDRILFVQLADARPSTAGLLEWSRHHRLFPGQGSWDLRGLVASVHATGYRGPLSLEVFNDVFRQADPHSTAVDARRSLLAITGPDRDPAPTAAPATGVASITISVDAASMARVGQALTALGLAPAGAGRWACGAACVRLDTRSGRAGAISGIGLETPEPATSLDQAVRLLAPAPVAAAGSVVAPDGIEIVFAPPGGPAGGEHIDHIGLTQPFDRLEEAALFYRSLLQTDAPGTSEFAAPFGLMRILEVASPDRAVRLVLSAPRVRRGDWAPGVPHPQYVAFATDDAVAAVRRARDRGAPMLRIPDNYYDDLAARSPLDPGLLDELCELGILYDHDATGGYLHAYTELLGAGVFLGLVQRIGGYTGCGAPDWPVRMAAHRWARARTA